MNELRRKVSALLGSGLDRDVLVDVVIDVVARFLRRNTGRPRKDRENNNYVIDKKELSSNSAGDDRGSGSALSLISDPDLSKPIRKKGERDEPPGFVEFWSAYPRKEGKAAARRAWLRQRPPVEKCLATLKWQATCEDWTKDGGDYIPHPATWINAGRWEDQPRPRVMKVNSSREVW